MCHESSDLTPAGGVAGVSPPQQFSQLDFQVVGDLGVLHLVGMRVAGSAGKVPRGEPYDARVVYLGALHGFLHVLAEKRVGDDGALGQYHPSLRGVLGDIAHQTEVLADELFLRNRIRLLKVPVIGAERDHDRVGSPAVVSPMGTLRGVIGDNGIAEELRSLHATVAEVVAHYAASAVADQFGLGVEAAAGDAGVGGTGVGGGVE